MKAKNLAPYLIALSVIGCSLALLAVLTFALSGRHWGGHGRRLEVEFPDATGIKLHSAARYAGAVAGTVVGMRYLKPQERAQTGKRDLAVRVTILLNAEVPPLPSDIQASLGSETILGEKFVALTAGSPDVAPLADGAVIPGQSMSSIDGLTQALEKTADSATELLRRFNADYPSLKTNLTQLLSTGDTLLNSATNLIGDAQAAIADVRTTLGRVDLVVSNVAPDASSLLAEARAAATNLNRTIENTRTITANVQGFLTNQFLINLDQSMKNLTGALARLELTSEYAKILAAKLAEKPSRLIWQMRSNKLPSEEEIRQRVPAPRPPRATK